MHSFPTPGRAGSALDVAAIRLGAELVPGACRFLVWAPRAGSAALHLVHPEDRSIPLTPIANGYYFAQLEDVAAGARYFYTIDGDDFPDPASRSQPSGVHGPSEVVSDAFRWTDSAWKGIALQDYVFYELHVGTFTPEGTFDGVAGRLDYFRQLGVTAIEIMPVAQFPGSRNWGYDGVYPYAVQLSYGGPERLKALVDAAHSYGIAVVLDVVYNHLGPEGNYLSRFGPYFTDRYETPWGQAVNFDGPDAAPVRRYFIDNALQWVRDFHFDALRLDAVHGMFDNSECHILEEMADVVHSEAGRQGRRIHLVAESDLNQTFLVRPATEGGCGLDAHWADDLHHSLHCLLTDENGGYYSDFGACEHLAAAYQTGYVYTGQYSVYRDRPHGEFPEGVPKVRFVVCAQNHDQVGNRMLGERLSALVPFEAQKLAAGAILLSPFLPLLFMGEEYGETAPFLYFASHSDPDLVEAVRRGRREEFAAFRWAGEVPDAHDPETFERSRLDLSLCSRPPHDRLYELYRTLLRLRPGPAVSVQEQVEALPFEELRAVTVRRDGESGQSFLALHFGDEPVRLEAPAPEGTWNKVIDSADPVWLGPGSAVPDRVLSGGTLQLDLAPLSFCFLTRSAGSARQVREAR